MRNKIFEWLGHVWRVDDQTIKQVLVVEMRSKRPLGRPKTKWRVSIMKDLKTLQDRIQIDMVYNREGWKKYVMMTLDLNGPSSCI